MAVSRTALAAGIAAAMGLASLSTRWTTPTVSNARKVSGSEVVALSLVPLQPDRQRRGTISLLLTVESYRPAQAGDVEIVVRRRDTIPPTIVDRLSIFPGGPFPRPGQTTGRTFRVQLGPCTRPDDWPCDPQLEVLLDAGARGSTVGAEIILGEVQS